MATLTPSMAPRLDPRPLKVSSTDPPMTYAVTIPTTPTRPPAAPISSETSEALVVLRIVAKRVVAIILDS